MNKRYIVWALCALTAGLVSAQEVTETTDIETEPPVVLLEEVTVTGASVLHKEDRKVVLPDREQIRTATDGMDLLGKMQLPRISMNPLDGSIGLSGGGKVRLCINGVEADASELAAIRPEDVLRIEYHDRPGARYDGADVVIDCITRRREQGGSVGGDSFDCFGKGKWASIDHLSAQYNHGRSAWSLVAGYMGQRRDNWVRDYEETWHYPDRTVSRKEIGSPVSIGGDGVQSRLSYSLAENGRYLFNARLSLDHDYTPALEEGDRRTLLYTSDSPTAVGIYEHTTGKSTSPALDLYFQHSLGQGQQVIFDVTGTYIHTDSRRVYRESLSDEVLSESCSDIHGRKHSLIVEGCYEKQSGSNRLSGGVRHLQACTANRYEGSAAAEVSIRQAESSLFAEYGYRHEVWSATGSLTASRIRYSLAGRHTEKFSLQPALQLACRPSDPLFLRYAIGLRTQAPPLSALNDAVQEIQAGMVRRGNPGLKPFRILDQQLTADYNSRLLGVSLTLGYRHEYNPVMETVLYEEGLFVRTDENQRSFRRLNAEATFTLRPWEKHLSQSVTPLVYRYISRGNSYRHTHTIARLKVDADFSYGNWVLSYRTIMGPANTMYGEESLEETNMNTLLAGYKRPRWSVQAGVFNAFVREYRMKTCNANALVPFTSRAHSNRNRYFVMKLSFRLDYGRQTDLRDKRIDNEDRETGIMQGTK